MLGLLNLNGCALISGLVHLLKNNEIHSEIVCWELVGLFHNVSQCGQQHWAATCVIIYTAN
jgi:hypothetical protein